MGILAPYLRVIKDDGKPAADGAAATPTDATDAFLAEATLPGAAPEPVKARKALKVSGPRTPRQR